MREPERFISPAAVTVEVAQPITSKDAVVSGDLPKMFTSPPAEISTAYRTIPLRFVADL